MEHSIASFYKFTPLKSEQVEDTKAFLEATASRFNIDGLVILSTEGLNSTCSGTQENLRDFLSQLQKNPLIGELECKFSKSERKPFRRFKVAIREEIVTLGDKSIVPDGTHNHLSPQEWEKALQDPEAVIIDTRNWYETEIGKFKNAVELGIKEFNEFPEAVEKLNLPKDKKVLMYCTGGIRCEKAIFAMNKLGHNNVYQLQGGILKYLEELPNKSWEGECFVFDHRVAVDQQLQPSKIYALCPHCGQPSTEHSTCVRCDAESTACTACMSKAEFFKTCSKNCANQFKARPVKGRRQLLEPQTRKSYSPEKLKRQGKPLP